MDIFSSNVNPRLFFSLNSIITAHILHFVELHIQSDHLEKHLLEQNFFLIKCTNPLAHFIFILTRPF